MEKAEIRSDDLSNQNIKRILIVVRWPVGGIRTFLKYVISCFPSEIYRFSVVGTSTEGMIALRSELSDRVDHWTLISSEKKVATNLAKAVFRLNRKINFDAIHAQGFTSAIACIPTVLTSQSALLCTVHDTLSEMQFAGVRGSIRRLVLAAALRKCKIIHSVSKDAEFNLLSYFPSIRGKSVVIRNGIDARLFRNCENIDLHKRLGIESSVKIVGFFGRFMGPKGFKYLVAAIELLSKEGNSPNVHVVCFGSGAFIREEQEAIGHKGLESYFTFMPFQADVSGVMKGCDLIAMPSLSEACPLQPMEALCAGVPLVGTNCIGLREVLDKTPAVQVDTGDALSLAQGILRALEMGKEPFENFAPVAAERFDVRKATMDIYKLYEKVTG